MSIYCINCNNIRKPEYSLISGRCVHCGGAMFDSEIQPYNATKHWQEGTIEMVEDALVRGGFKYRRVYFDDNGSLQIEKERE